MLEFTSTCFNASQSFCLRITYTCTQREAVLLDARDDEELLRNVRGSSRERTGVNAGAVFMRVKLLTKISRHATANYRQHENSVIYHFLYSQDYVHYLRLHCEM